MIRAEKHLNCTVYKHVGTLGTNYRMNHLDLNVVKWFRNAPKFDLRYWSDTNMPDAKGGGITLDINQLRALKALLNSIDLDKSDNEMDYGYKISDFLSLENCNLQEVRKSHESVNCDTETTLPWD